jgi:hypothetical protein
MVDVLDAKPMFIRLRDAQGRFERGAPVPLAARELLDELVDALADSGPLELQVTPEAWLASIKSAEAGIAAADDGTSPKSVRRAMRSIRELKRFFGGRHLTWYDFLFLPVGLAVVIWVLPLVVVFVLIEKRYVPDARKVAVGLEMPDRLLFAHAVRAARSEVQSAARARLGAYVHPVLIATDRRVVLAQPPSERPARFGQHRFAVGWEVAYRHIRSFSSKTIQRGDAEEESVSIQTSEREITYELPSSAGKALAGILKRRIPKALDGHVASSSSGSRVPL